MLGLLLTQSPPRSASAGDDDYDVVGPDGWVSGWIARRGPSSCEESAHQCRARLHAYGSSVSWVRHSRTRAGSRFRWPKRGILRKGEKQSENEENQTAVSVIAGISVVPAENRHPAR
jgi:hypothetical protein